MKKLFVQTFEEFTNEKNSTQSRKIKENVEYEEEDFTHPNFSEQDFENIVQKYIRSENI